MHTEHGYNYLAGSWQTYLNLFKNSSNSLLKINMVSFFALVAVAYTLESSVIGQSQEIKLY